MNLSGFPRFCDCDDCLFAQIAQRQAVVLGKPSERLMKSTINPESPTLTDADRAMLAEMGIG